MNSVRSNETARPRIGLISGELSGIGGLEMSALRHIRLMADHLDIVSISLETSKDERDWSGRVERTERKGNRFYRIFAADFRIDKVIGLTDISKHSHLVQLEQIAREERLSALHVFGAFHMRPFIVALAAVRLDVPLIVSFRGVDLELRIFGPNFAHLQTALQIANQVVCVNSRAQRVVQRAFKPGGPVHVIHNHVDKNDFVNTEVQLNFPRPIIGCAGEFRRVMGLDTLLHAFTKLATDSTASLLLMGPFRPMESVYYTNLIDNFEYSQRVFRLGTISHNQILAYMNECDVLTFPSISDGSPNKVLEAMLAARAVVATDVGGIPEIIRDQVDGILVPMGDSQRLADALSALLNDPERRRALGENARERVLSTFTPAKARAAWLECYKSAGAC